MLDSEQQPSTTTVEQNLRTAGQRRINLIWEYTQAAIAIAIVLATVLSTFISGFLPKATNEFLLANAFFLVVGFYFGRTNHARLGDRAGTRFE